MFPCHIQVVVQHVHFDGLGRTKDDIIMCEIGEVFKAKNLIEASNLSASIPSKEPISLMPPQMTEHPTPASCW